MSDKTKNIIVIVLAIFTAIVAGVAIVDINPHKEITKETLENLISSNYEIAEFNVDTEDIDIVIKGDLTKEELIELSKDIFVTSKYDNNIKQQNINFTLIDGNSDYKDEFYYEGILYRGEISLGVAELNLYDFKNVQADIASDLLSYSSQKIVSSDANELKINIDMNFDGLAEQDILSQMKTYTDLFLRTNSDKEIKNIEVSVYGNESKYKYCSNFEDILVVSEKVKLL